jgi:DNA-binding CsgD family transcriptional regulator
LSETSAWTTELLDAMGLAAFLVGSDGRILAMSPAAAEMLRCGVAVRDVDGRLQAQEPDAQTALARALRQPSGAGRPVPLGPWSPRVRLAHVTPRKDADGYLVVLRVRDGAGAALLSWLRRERQVTDAEARVGFLVASGLAVREVAEHRNVSTETVRKQLKLLMQKLDVSSRQALVRLLTRLAGPFGAGPPEYSEDKRPGLPGE